METSNSQHAQSTGKQGGDYRATVTVMLALAAATATGFVREAALSYQLGAGRAMDIYLIAFTLPEFVFIALPIILSPAFIPLFVSCRLRFGEEQAWLFGKKVASALLILLLGSTIVAALGAPLYVRWLAPGFSPVEHSRAIRATRQMLPAVILMGLATLAGAVLQVYRRFARPALIAAIYNVTFVVVLLAVPLWNPVDRAAWGVTLGAGVALAVQLPLLWKHRLPSLGREQESIVGVAQLAWVVGPLSVGYAVHHVIRFVDRAMATTLVAGGVATINYAYHLALVVGQLSGLSVSTTLFPRIAEQIASDDLVGARASLSEALLFVWAVGLPASCGLIVLRVPLVQVLFERGAFDQVATAAVSDVLVWYALATLADALCQPLWRAVYAWRGRWTVAAVNGLQTGIRFLCNIALLRALGYVGLAISAFLGLSVQVILLGWLIRRRLGAYLGSGWWRSVAYITLATAVTVIVVMPLVSPMSTMSPVAALVGCAGLGGLAYLMVLLCNNYWRRMVFGVAANIFSNKK